MMPNDLFHRAGLALFGEQYVAPMAALLGVADKGTVRKWSNGKSRIPPDVWPRISHALQRRGKAVHAVLLEIGSAGLAQ